MRRRIIAAIIAISALAGAGAATAATTTAGTVAHAPFTHYYDLVTIALLAATTYP